MASIIGRIAKKTTLLSGAAGGIIGGGCGIKMAYDNFPHGKSLPPHYMLGEIYCASIIVAGSTGLGAMLGTCAALSSPVIIPYTIFKKLNEHRKRF